MGIFTDSSGRPKKTPRHKSFIIITVDEKYPHNKMSKMPGGRLHAVKAEIRAQGFETLGENTGRHGKPEWAKTDETLDMIARHQAGNLTARIENRNTPYPVPKYQITSKIEMCDCLKIKPVFACRWLEPHGYLLKNGGFFVAASKAVMPQRTRKICKFAPKAIWVSSRGECRAAESIRQRI